MLVPILFEKGNLLTEIPTSSLLLLSSVVLFFVKLDIHTTVPDIFYIILLTGPSKSIFSFLLCMSPLLCLP